MFRLAVELGGHLQLELLPLEVVLQPEGGGGGGLGDGGDDEEEEELHHHSDVVNWCLSLKR